jgi:hypothetical protein
MNNRPFIHEDFLLDTPEARELYHRDYQNARRFFGVFEE